MEPPTTWAWIRAGMITLILAVNVLFAAPIPPRIHAHDLEVAEGREELSRWLGVLNGLGVEVDRRELSRTLIATSKVLNELNSDLRRPFLRPLQLFGVGQAWALFASPDTYPHRLELDVFQKGGWQKVYARLDPSSSFDEPALRYRRIRGIYDAGSRRSSGVYWSFTRWIAKRVFLAYPDAERVRVQLVQTHTTLPWEPPDREETPRQIRIHKRSAVLPDDGLVP